MATESVPKILGQLRPADTNAASLYSPGANISAEITALLVCNQSGSVAAFRVFLDDDGTTYDQTTALFYDVSLGAGLTFKIPENGVAGWGMSNPAGNLAVRSSVNDALTFTVFGRE